MTLAEKIKTFNNKIEAKEAKYNLDRETAHISAQPSGNLDKYEYLTGQDVTTKLGVIAQKQFEYSPIAQTFNKKTVEANINNKTNNKTNQMKTEKVNQNLYCDPRYGFFKYRDKNCHPHLNLTIQQSCVMILIKQKVSIPKKKRR